MVGLAVSTHPTSLFVPSHPRSTISRSGNDDKKDMPRLSEEFVRGGIQRLGKNIRRTRAHVPSMHQCPPSSVGPLEDGTPRARDEHGHTPLDIAKLNGKARLVEWITKRLRSNSR